MMFSSSIVFLPTVFFFIFFYFTWFPVQTKITLFHTNAIHSFSPPTDDSLDISAKYYAQLQSLFLTHPHALKLNTQGVINIQRKWVSSKGKVETELFNLLGFHATGLGTLDLSLNTSLLFSNVLHRAEFDILTSSLTLSNPRVTQGYLKGLKKYAVYPVFDPELEKLVQIAVISIGPENLCESIDCSNSPFNLLLNPQKVLLELIKEIKKLHNPHFFIALCSSTSIATTTSSTSLLSILMNTVSEHLDLILLSHPLDSSLFSISLNNETSITYPLQMKKKHGGVVWISSLKEAEVGILHLSDQNVFGEKVHPPWCPLGSCDDFHLKHSSNVPKFLSLLSSLSNPLEAQKNEFQFTSSFPLSTQSCQSNSFCALGQLMTSALNFSTSCDFSIVNLHDLGQDRLNTASFALSSLSLVNQSRPFFSYTFSDLNSWFSNENQLVILDLPWTLWKDIVEVWQSHPLQPQLQCRAPFPFFIHTSSVSSPRPPSFDSQVRVCTLNRLLPKLPQALLHQAMWIQPQGPHLIHLVSHYLNLNKFHFVPLELPKDLHWPMIDSFPLQCIPPYSSTQDLLSSFSASFSRDAQKIELRTVVPTPTPVLSLQLQEFMFVYLPWLPSSSSLNDSKSVTDLTLKSNTSRFVLNNGTRFISSFLIKSPILFRNWSSLFRRSLEFSSPFFSSNDASSQRLFSSNHSCHPGSILNGTDCVPCLSGFITDSSDQTCKPCPAGYFSINGTMCEPCPKGMFNPSSGSSCQPCLDPYFQSDLGQSSCQTCLPPLVRVNASICICPGTYEVYNPIYNTCDSRTLVETISMLALFMGAASFILVVSLWSISILARSSTSTSPPLSASPLLSPISKPPSLSSSSLPSPSTVDGLNASLNLTQDHLGPFAYVFQILNHHKERTLSPPLRIQMDQAIALLTSHVHWSPQTVYPYSLTEEGALADEVQAWLDITGIPSVLSPARRGRWSTSHSITSFEEDLGSEKDAATKLGTNLPLAEKRMSALMAPNALPDPQLALMYISKDVFQFSLTQTNQIHDLIQEKGFHWDFDVFQWTTLTQGHPLLFFAYYVLKKFHVISTLGLNEIAVVKYLDEIEQTYQRHPYHNSIHATDVLQAMCTFLMDPRFQTALEPLDWFTIVIACAIHDVDHPGVNNNFLAQTKHPLASLYSDQSILEFHHLATGFMVAERYQLFQPLTKPQWSQVRKSVIELILATDMAKHFEFGAKFKTWLATFTPLASTTSTISSSSSSASSSLLAPPSSCSPLPNSTPPTNTAHLTSWALESPETKQLVLNMAIKCSDINNPTRALSLSKKWAHRIMEEFYLQGDQERARGMPISNFMDRSKHDENKSKCQISFIDVIVNPLYQIWVPFLTSSELKETILTNLTTTKKAFSQFPFSITTSIDPNSVTLSSPTTTPSPDSLFFFSSVIPPSSTGSTSPSQVDSSLLSAETSTMSTSTSPSTSSSASSSVPVSSTTGPNFYFPTYPVIPDSPSTLPTSSWFTSATSPQRRGSHVIVGLTEWAFMDSTSKSNEVQPFMAAGQVGGGSVVGTILEETEEEMEGFEDTTT